MRTIYEICARPLRTGNSGPTNSTLLVATNDRVKTAREKGLPALSTRTLNVLTRHYDHLITAGYAANAPPQRTGLAGRPKRTKSANLLRRLDRYRDDVLRFATDFNVPFSNNQAERDLRMVELQQKISGCYRTESGATNYLTVRSYVSTMRKQGHPVTGLRQLLEGERWMPVALART